MGNLAYFKLYMEKAADGNWQVKVKVGANKRNISKLSSYMMLISKPTRWEIFQTKLSSYMMLISKPTRWGILYLNLYTYCLFLKNSILKFLWRNCLTYWLIFLRIKKFSRYTMSNVWLLFRPLYIWDMCR